MSSPAFDTRRRGRSRRADFTMRWPVRASYAALRGLPTGRTATRRAAGGRTFTVSTKENIAMNAAWKLASIAAATAVLAGCGTRTVEREVVRERPIVQQQQPAVVERVVVVQQPAAPSEQIPPAPAPSGYSWVAGHHVWQDGRWQWVPGAWVSGTARPLPAPVTEPPPTASPDTSSRWVPGHWRWSGNDWVWVKGRWN
jgi:hypothetical protein